MNSVQTPSPFRPNQHPPSLHFEDAPRFQFATPYGPNVGDDGLDHTFVPDILNIMEEGWSAMRQTAPDGSLIALALHGSLVKGRAHTGSDADGVAFYRADLLSTVTTSPAAWCLGAVEKHIISRFQEQGYQDRFLQPTSYSYIDLSDAVFDDAITSALQYAPMGESFYESAVLNHQLLPLFFMQLGPGRLQEYRTRLLARLSHETNGQLVCQMLMNRLWEREEMRRKAYFYLPRKIADVACYFECELQEK